MSVPTFGQGIEWIAGGTQAHCPELYCGENYLVAVRVCSDDKSREWWEFQVITVTETGFEVDGNGWGWSWEDVDWYVPVKFLTPPVLAIESK